MQPRAYWRQSDRALNPNFNRRRGEPAWVLRREIMLLGGACKKPPDRPPKRRRAVSAKDHRPVIKTAQNDNTPQHDKAEARRVAEALFGDDAP
jgi:hypothetical protein